MKTANLMNPRIIPHSLSQENENVRVIVRCRPMSRKELKCGYYKVVHVQRYNGEVRIFNPKEEDAKGKAFTFDAVYDCNSTQDDLYIESVQPVVNSVLEGFNGTIFAYGQTGTGKTFTMEGNQLDPSSKGVIPKSFEHIFNHISQSKSTQYLVRASYVEIYKEQVKDLLDGNGNMSYELRGDYNGIMIKNLKSYVCKNVNEIEAIMKHGNRNRKIGMTNMNDHSSRSHTIFIITIEMSKIIYGVNSVRVSKLNLVDLAGSERQSKSCASNERLKESCKINLSLSALGNVISALSNGKISHIPYRDSKLTRILQDSLGGNSKTLMIANVGPASYNYDESLMTLRYANRAKNIKNRPRLHEDSKDALIRQYQNEIKRLKALVQSKNITVNNNNSSSSNNNDDCDNNNNNNETFGIDNKIKNVNEKTQEKEYLNKKDFIHNSKIYLRKKIELMESKLLNGEKIITRTKNQEIMLKKQNEEIMVRLLKRKKIKNQIKKEKELTEKFKKCNMNLEIDIKNQKKEILETLKRIQTINKQTTNMIKNCNKEPQESDIFLSIHQYELIKKYKINQIIIENFIPLSERQKFSNLINY